MGGVTDDKTGRAELEARLRALAGLEVRIGVLQPLPTKDGDSTIAVVAAAHEYGTADIPQRSFIGSTIDKSRSELGALAIGVGRRVAEGASPEQAAGEAGLVIAGMIRKTITSNVPPALKPATIAAKGGNTSTLIETGQLLRSIAHEVVPATGAS